MIWLSFALGWLLGFATLAVALEVGRRLRAATMDRAMDEIGPRRRMQS